MFTSRVTVPRIADVSKLALMFASVIAGMQLGAPCACRRVAAAGRGFSQFRRASSAVPASSDRLVTFAATNFGGSLLRGLGLPCPPTLSRTMEPMSQLVTAQGAPQLVVCPGSGSSDASSTLVASTCAEWKGTAGSSKARSLVIDATALRHPSELVSLYEATKEAVAGSGEFRRRNGRVVVVGLSPDACASAAHASVAGALEGFTRSLAKEIGGSGATCNLLYLANAAAGTTSATAIDAPLRFFLSDHSAFVTCQALTVDVSRSVVGSGSPSAGLGLDGKVSSRRDAGCRRCRNHGGRGLHLGCRRDGGGSRDRCFCRPATCGGRRPRGCR